MGYIRNLFALVASRELQHRKAYVTLPTFSCRRPARESHDLIIYNIASVYTQTHTYTSREFITYYGHLSALFKHRVWL